MDKVSFSQKQIEFLKRFGGEKMPERVAQILSEASFGEDYVELNSGTLSRSDYEAVRTFLERIGGKWKGSKGKKHEDGSPVGRFVFQHVSPQSIVEAFVAIRFLPVKNPLDFFPTPRKVALELLTFCGLLSFYEWEGVYSPTRTNNQLRILEPNAGLGGLADVIREFYPDAQIDCVELNPISAQILRKKGYNVYEQDFLEFNNLAYYDYVVMNPPFDGTTYIKHVLHAWEMVEHRLGIVAGILPNTIRNTQKNVESFWRFVHCVGATEPLASGSFKDSGTNVETIMFYIDKETQEASKNRGEFNGYPNYGVWHLIAIIENNEHDTGYRQIKELAQKGTGDAENEILQIVKDTQHAYIEAGGVACLEANELQYIVEYFVEQEREDIKEVENDDDDEDENFYDDENGYLKMSVRGFLETGQKCFAKMTDKTGTYVSPAYFCFGYKRSASYNGNTIDMKTKGETWHYANASFIDFPQGKSIKEWIKQIKKEYQESEPTVNVEPFFGDYTKDADYKNAKTYTKPKEEKPLHIFDIYEVVGNGSPQKTKTFQIKAKSEETVFDFLYKKLWDEVPAIKGYYYSLPEQDVKMSRVVFKNGLADKVVKKAVREGKSKLFLQLSLYHKGEKDMEIIIEKQSKDKKQDMKKQELLKFSKEALKFVPKAQLSVVNSNPDEFQDVIERINEIVANMPKLYEQDGNSNPIVYLHYFHANQDWYITEKDFEDRQLQAYGNANLGYGGEWGYINIENFVNSLKVELNFYFEPMTFRQITATKENKQPSFKVSDKVKYQVGDLYIEDWYGEVKSVVGLDNNGIYLYRLEAFNHEYRNKASEKHTEISEGRLTKISEETYLKHLKNWQNKYPQTQENINTNNPKPTLQQNLEALKRLYKLNQTPEFKGYIDALKRLIKLDKA
jgi:hypothetical protein